MNLVILGASAVAVAALAGTARLLALGARDPLSPADAAREAEHALAGFEARRAIVSREGRSALVEGAHGFALVREQGAHVVARALANPRVDVRGERLIVHAGERIFGATTLDLGIVEARVWAERLDAG